MKLRWVLAAVFVAAAAVVWAQPEDPTGLIVGKYYLVVTKNGSGVGTVSGTGVDCGSDCNEAFLPNTPVTLTATASSGNFTGWSGACSGTGSCIVTMSQARAVTATFTASAGGGAREVAADTLDAQGKFFCHRSFQTTGWTQVSTSVFPSSYYESDQDFSDTTLCGFRLDNKALIYSTMGAATVGTGPNGLLALQITGGPGGTTNVETWNGSASYQQGSISGRMGFRYYSWMSDSNTCEATKIIQMGLYWSMGLELPAGDPDPTGLIKWQGASETIAFASDQFRNKWVRVEGYINGTYATPTGMTLIMKNITDGTAEVSRTVTTTCVGTGSFCMRSANPGPDNNQLSNFTQYIHMYRDNRSWPGTCVNKYSYLLVGHNLGSSERIPASCEVEGGC
jgi:hypothetical protein